MLHFSEDPGITRFAATARQPYVRAVDADRCLRRHRNLWPFWDAVTASTAGFSGIRLRNARPRA
ncbi:DUF6886 family protein [Amycolatopsis sp. WGS_07]|uniref:DUF6886 family protein n=1 Tax=Amycolatopsis sp. WGS_07 TaxID=3076764 RepID=UPI003872BBD6